MQLPASGSELSGGGWTDSLGKDTVLVLLPCPVAMMDIIGRPFTPPQSQGGMHWKAQLSRAARCPLISPPGSQPVQTQDGCRSLAKAREAPVAHGCNAVGDRVQCPWKAPDPSSLGIWNWALSRVITQKPSQRGVCCLWLLDRPHPSG